MLPFSSLVRRPRPKKFDVFLSFSGKDTRRTLISFLYKELIHLGLRTFKDDMEVEIGRRFSYEISLAIENSKVAIVVVSEEYPASKWCLDELVKIMDVERKGSLTVVPIFYHVDPSDLRWQKHKVAEQFKKHEEREGHETVVSWREALVNFASISGLCSRDWQDDSKLVEEVAKRISKKLSFSATPSSNVIGIHLYMNHLRPLSHFACKNGVRIYGIWTEEGTSRSALARDIYQSISQQFQSHCFLENVEVIPQKPQISHLRKRAKIQGGYTSSSFIKTSFMSQKVLLVVNNVTSYDQLNALEDDFNCFGSGSVVVIATQSISLLVSYAKRRLYNVSYPSRKSELRELVYKVRLKIAFISILIPS